jgi:hypothetical protein
VLYAAGAALGEKPLQPFVRETFNHGKIVTRCVTYSNTDGKIRHKTKNQLTTRSLAGFVYGIRRDETVKWCARRDKTGHWQTVVSLP